MSTTPASDPGTQLARETRARFVEATDAAIGLAAQAVHERLAALANEAGTAREMQERRDHLIAYRGAETNWVSLARSQWRQALRRDAPFPAGASGGLSPRLELVGDE